MLVCSYFLLAFQLIGLSQTIEYQYDNAGNRVLRHVVVLEQKMAKIDTTQFQLDLLGEQMGRVYPNPTRGWLLVNINHLEPAEQSQLLVYTMSGAMIIRKEDISTVTRIDLNAQSPGMYIMRIILGDKTSEWKIIKK